MARFAEVLTMFLAILVQSQALRYSVCDQSKTQSIHGNQVLTLDERNVSLSQFRDDVLLVVNVATY